MSIVSVALSPCQDESLGFPVTGVGCNSPQANESILIFLSIANSVIPIHVLESDSIASVKLRIQQTYKGNLGKLQKLVLDGRELARTNSRVRDYGLGEGNILHLVLRLSDLQAITVNTVCGKKFEFHVEKSRNVGYIKQQIASKGGDYVDFTHQKLICHGEELEDQRLVQDICKHNDAVIHLLVRNSARVKTESVDSDFEVLVEAPKLDYDDVDDASREESEWSSLTRKLPDVTRKSVVKDFVFERIVVNSNIVCPFEVEELVNSTYDGLKSGNWPIRTSEGSGGAYFMQDASGQKHVAVFKPMDEEPLAVNNPQGLRMSADGEGLKKGTRVGEGAFREVAAYILDHPRSEHRSMCHEDKGFAGVPPTVMVKCLHKGFNYPEGFEFSSNNIKIGSLQQYVQNDGSCEDMGPRDFPVEEVHKISVLDMRLANADRHAGNILVRREGDGNRIKLIPIDHGYCLPENFKDCTFEWLYWPQARQPYSPEIVNYIQSLDAERDIELLKSHGWNIPIECARTLRISTMLLRKGVERGLTPFSIGSIMCRENLKSKSKIELIVELALDSVLPETSETAFLETVSLIMDDYIDKMI
ncbi:unnamed protein product [Rhodiola kirilowii]